ncbi:MAG TPA: iron-sulfur cluster co-chaperone HscB C-terminal domain-containing protein [Phycisphaerales bacterium]|nr:iron-sulfur cluster co-chaperone HscB C-terminal domain-containing protein [Phycisphaerales bacterium]
MNDPFEILGLPKRFELSPRDVERAYLARSAGMHPDAGGEGTGQAALNDARDVLLNTEARAEALLLAMGGKGKSEDKSLPGGFLVEMMETREAMESASSDAERLKWRDWAMEQRGAFERAVGELFRLAEVDRTALHSVRCQLNAWRYIERMIEQLDPSHDSNQADFKGSR